MPNISSNTIAFDLPGTTIGSTDATPLHKTRITQRQAVKVPRTAVLAKQSWFSLRTSVSLLVLVLNVFLFGWYLYGVNSFEGLHYSSAQAQKEVARGEDRQRQLQVKIAEATSAMRLQDVTNISAEFVPVGTPEFVSAENPQLSMR